ncbi:chemotaxis protein CheD [Halobacterium bonnevillei]|uniref:Probable chemoreceptor glutamine deamidase CheD n=1 Tax=Halobacterium bonnevillei TaxID=2692200 RepID=A0A6B0SIQ9_9EURY|nr:chemotaxis protein CheD [Halobacterium bonnevillei]MXR21027.1 chemotaxis protein CheD [Halobacterium bonnevillei]
MSSGAQKTRVSVADWRVLDGEGPLVTSGLGSCVAVSVYDTDDAIGGLLHAMLPAAPSPVETPAKYVDSGLDEMLSAIYRRGASPDTVAAKVVGGSSMLDISVGEAIGDRNVEAAERALDDAGVPLVAAETGGNSGRSVSFCPASGDVTIDRVDSEVEVI